MPLDGFDRDQIARTASGMLGHYQGKLSLPEIGQRIAARYTGLTNSDRAIILATVVQQRNLFDRGRDLQFNPDPNATSKPTVTDWSLYGLNGQYGWRVEVSVYNPATGDSYTRLIVVTSGDPLTAAEIRQQAEDQFRRDPTSQGRYPERGGITAQTSINTIILTAGKNPI